MSADARSVALGDTLTAEEFGSLLSTDSAEYEQMHASVDGWEGKTHVQLEVDIDQTDPTRPRARVQYELDGAQMDRILIGDDVYVAAIDVSDLYLKMQVDEGLVPFGIGENDAAIAGGFLESDDINSATYLGEVEVAGVPSRHFSIDGRASMKDAEVYLDEDGRVIRIEVTNAGAPLTTTFSRFGQSVKIVAPKNFQAFPSMTPVTEPQ